MRNMQSSRRRSSCELLSNSYESDSYLFIVPSSRPLRMTFLQVSPSVFKGSPRSNSNAPVLATSSIMRVTARLRAWKPSSRSTLRIHLNSPKYLLRKPRNHRLLPTRLPRRPSAWPLLRKQRLPMRNFEDLGNILTQ